MVLTPFGKGIAHFVYDSGDETYWGVFQRKTSELWWWPNHEIRYDVHLSEGFTSPSPIHLSDKRKQALAPHMKRHE
jgi:hypothetical protein